MALVSTKNSLWKLFFPDSGASRTVTCVRPTTVVYIGGGQPWLPRVATIALRDFEFRHDQCKTIVP